MRIRGTSGSSLSLLSLYLLFFFTSCLLYALPLLLLQTFPALFFFYILKTCCNKIDRLAGPFYLRTHLCFVEAIDVCSSFSVTNTVHTFMSHHVVYGINLCLPFELKPAEIQIPPKKRKKKFLRYSMNV